MVQITCGSIYTRHLVKVDVHQNSMKVDVHRAVPRTATRKKTNRFPRTRRCGSREQADVDFANESIDQWTDVDQAVVSCAPQKPDQSPIPSRISWTVMVLEACLLSVLCTQEHGAGKTEHNVAVCESALGNSRWRPDQRIVQSYIDAHRNVSRCHHI